MAGSFTEELEIDQLSPVPGAGAEDIFLVRLDPQSGDAVWAASFGGAGDQTVSSLAPDGWGNVIIAGAFDGELGFGPDLLPHAGHRDVFVGALDSMGGHLWSRSFGGPHIEVALGVTAHRSGAVTLTGHFDGELPFDPAAPLGTAGGNDVFVLRLAGGQSGAGGTPDPALPSAP